MKTVVWLVALSGVAALGLDWALSHPPNRRGLDLNSVVGRKVAVPAQTAFGSPLPNRSSWVVMAPCDSCSVRDMENDPSIADAVLVFPDGLDRVRIKKRDLGRRLAVISAEQTNLDPVLFRLAPVRLILDRGAISRVEAIP